MVHYLVIIQNKETLEPTQILLKGEDQLGSFMRNFNPHKESLVTLQFVGDAIAYDDWKQDEKQSDDLNFG